MNRSTNADAGWSGEGGQGGAEDARSGETHHADKKEDPDEHAYDWQDELYCILSTVAAAAGTAATAVTSRSDTGPGVINTACHRCGRGA